MLRPVAILSLAAAAAAASLPVSRQLVPELGGPQVPDAARTCTKSGEKCAGANGFPEVVFKGCCDNRLTCAIPADAPSGLWGRFCITSDMVAATTTTTDAPATTAAAGATTAAAGAAGAAGGSGTVTTVAGATTVVGATTAASSAGGTTAAAGIINEDIDEAVATDDDDGSVCFPGAATVELASGATVPMSALAVGDVVKVGVNEFSPVFMFTHKLADAVHDFVTLTTASGATLSLTKGHYLYVNGDLAAAKTVSVGDVLTLGSGSADAVVAVGAASAAGLFNPQTVSGNVVVDGVLASTYTTAVEPRFAHAALAPLRALASAGLAFCGLESGADALAALAPSGAAVL